MRRQCHRARCLRGLQSVPPPSLPAPTRRYPPFEPLCFARLLTHDALLKKDVDSIGRLISACGTHPAFFKDFSLALRKCGSAAVRALELLFSRDPHPLFAQLFLDVLASQPFFSDNFQICLKDALSAAGPDAAFVFAQEAPASIFSTHIIAVVERLPHSARELPHVVQRALPKIFESAREEAAFVCADYFLRGLTADSNFSFEFVRGAQFVPCPAQLRVEGGADDGEELSEGRHGGKIAALLEALLTNSLLAKTPPAYAEFAAQLPPHFPSLRIRFLTALVRQAAMGSQLLLRVFEFAAAAALGGVWIRAQVEESCGEWVATIVETRIRVLRNAVELAARGGNAGTALVAAVALRAAVARAHVPVGSLVRPNRNPFFSRPQLYDMALDARALLVAVGGEGGCVAESVWPSSDDRL